MLATPPLSVNTTLLVLEPSTVTVTVALPGISTSALLPARPCASVVVRTFASSALPADHSSTAPWIGTPAVVAKDTTIGADGERVGSTWLLPETMVSGPAAATAVSVKVTAAAPSSAARTCCAPPVAPSV